MAASCAQPQPACGRGTVPLPSEMGETVFRRPPGPESCEFLVTGYKARKSIWVGVSQRGPHLSVPPLPQIQAALPLGLQDTQVPGSASVEKTVEDSGLWLRRALCR